MESFSNFKNTYFISGMIKPSQLYISAPSDRNLETWKALGAHTSHNNGWQEWFCEQIAFRLKVFAHNKENVIGGWRKLLLYEEFHDMHA